MFRRTRLDIEIFDANGIELPFETGPHFNYL